MCCSQFTPSPSGLTGHPLVSPFNSLCSPQLWGRVGRTQPHTPSSLPERGRQGVRSLPLFPPPLLLLTLSISPK